MLMVRDIMTPNPMAFSPETTREEAVLAFVSNRFGGAPVVENGRVVGVLSKTDLLDPERSGETVGDLMTPLVFYLRGDEPAMTAVRLMRAEGVHRLAVVKAHGRLAGIVTTTDILRALERGESFHEGDEIPRRIEQHSEPESVMPPAR